MNVAEKLISSPFTLYAAFGLMTVAVKATGITREFNEKFGEREKERKRILAELRSKSL